MGLITRMACAKSVDGTGFAWGDVMVAATTALLAIFDIGMQVLKFLAILGGAAVGWFGGSVSTKAMGVALKRKQMPQPVRRMNQTLGGLLLGIATGMWVTGEGGGGFGFGPGMGSGPGGSEPTSMEQQTAPMPATPSVQEGDKGGEPLQPITLRVTMLGGGQVRDQRFYQLEEEATPLTLAGLRDTLLERRRQKQRGILKGLEIVITPESVAKDHPAVRELEKWARENDLRVTMSFPRGDQP